MTALDAQLLERHRRFVDRDTGISEEFVQTLLGGARTSAILYRPLRATKQVGWVICHSFGMEQMHLMRHEVQAARHLAAAGFPVLRYHGQGYGDSAADQRVIGLASHLADAADALRLLRDKTGVEQVGLAGARFGALVAALLADREHLRYLILWQPLVRGADLVGRLARSRHAWREESAAPERRRRRSLFNELMGSGSDDPNGMFLSSEAHLRIATADLTRDLRAFSGRALVVGVSPGAAPEPEVDALVEHLRSLGAIVDMERFEDLHPLAYGEHHYEITRDTTGLGIIDRHADLASRLAVASASWARSTATGENATQKGAAR